MPNQNNCSCHEQSQGKEHNQGNEQSQGNIRSSKKKGKGKFWSEEDMAEAEPYPIEVSEETLKRLQKEKEQKKEGETQKEK